MTDPDKYFEISSKELKDIQAEVLELLRECHELTEENAVLHYSERSLRADNDRLRYNLEALRDKYLK